MFAPLLFYKRGFIFTGRSFRSIDHTNLNCMKRKETVNIIRKRFKKINAAFRALMLHFDAEDIHDFRVEVKKLKAFLRFAGTAGTAGTVGTASPGTSGKGPAGLKLPKKLRELYRISGTLRNLQLQQQNIRNAWPAGGAESPDHYLYLLITESVCQVTQAKRLVKGKRSFKKEERQIIGQLPLRPGKKIAERFVRAHTSNIRDLLAVSSPTDDSFHTIRKKLKDLQYTGPYTGGHVTLPESPERRPAGFPLTDKEIVSFTGLLGDLQDLCIGIELLQPAYTNRVSPEKERMGLVDLRRQWQKEKERKEQEVYIKLTKKLLPA